MRRTYRYLDLITALFVAVLLISNVASAAKIVNLGLPFLTFDAGTLLFPVSYIFGDVLVEVYGYRLSRRIIWAGFGSAALLSASLAIVRLLPGDVEWQTTVGAAAFDGVLGSLASGRIILASLLAYFAGEFSNAYIMAKMKIRTEGRWLWTRTIASTIVGELVDTVIFVAIAFLGVWPLSLVGQIIISNYLFKCGVELLATPLTYRLINHLKRAEEVDHFDLDTNFNPFRLTAA
ncbi:MAG TPA: queuosine precursor transporter [Anaerolineae bacterium]|nr:queuosine precursor transporter [Anaerolineae bacterium]